MYIKDILILLQGSMSLLFTISAPQFESFLIICLLAHQLFVLSFSFVLLSTHWIFYLRNLFFSSYIFIWFIKIISVYLLRYYFYIFSIITFSVRYLSILTITSLKILCWLISSCKLSQMLVSGDCLSFKISHVFLFCYMVNSFGVYYCL